MTKKSLLWGLIGATLLGVIATVLYPALAQSSVSRRAYSNPVATARREEAIRLEEEADVAWHKEKDYAKAERLFREANDLHSSSPSRRIALSEMLCEQGKIKEAFLAYKEAVHPDPSQRTMAGYFDPVDLSHYADLAQKVGATAEADWAAREIVLTAYVGYPAFPTIQEADLRQWPVQAMADLAVGLSWSNRNEKQKALGIFKLVAAKNPRLALAHLYVAREYERIIGVGATPAREAYRHAARLNDPAVKKIAVEKLKSWGDSAGTNQNQIQ